MLNKLIQSKYLLPIIILLSLFLYAWQLNKLPLTAYDEAVYAQVTQDTLASDDILTLKYFNNNWFEKPPLYFWLTMGLNKVLGESEYVYRLISILSALLTIILTYCLTKKLTKDKIIASLAAITLLLMPYYFLTARQMRLDFPVVASILASLYFLISGWEKPKKLFWLFPIIGLGVMFKSVIALLSIPILIIFSFIYRHWSWLKQKYLWWGLPLSLLIVIPWHWQQHIVWGNSFWSAYLGSHVINRFETGYGIEAINYFDYLSRLWYLSQPWWQIFLLLIILFFIIKLKNKRTEINKLFLSSTLTVFFILIIFSLAKTHIPTYLLPAYPFMAIVIAWGLTQLWKNKNIKIILTGLFIISTIYALSLSLGINKYILNQLQLPFDNDFKNIGLTVKDSPDPYENFYQLNWIVGETLSNYADKKIITISTDYPEPLIGPFYLVTTQANLTIFFDNNGQIKPAYQQLRVRYYANGFILLYSPVSLDLKVF